MREDRRAGPAAVLIVARRDDAVACRVHRALLERDVEVEWKLGAEAARLFTVTVGEGGVSVYPDVPMFVRPSAWWTKTDPDPDKRFLFRESYATFWAAASLCRSPVLNRPGSGGSSGRLTAGALGGAEIHVAARELVEDDGTYWIEDAEFRTGRLAMAKDGLPLRARRVNPDAEYEIVVVVGAEAFRATTDARIATHDLAARSVTLARRSDVHFASVIWEVVGDAAHPVRFNSSPDMSELRYRLTDVMDALCRAMLT